MSYDRDIKRLLRDVGGRVKRRGKGSHEIWSVPDGKGGVFTISVPQDIRSRVTANEILKQVGIDAKV